MYVLKAVKRANKVEKKHIEIVLKCNNNKKVKHYAEEKLKTVTIIVTENFSVI